MSKFSNAKKILSLVLGLMSSGTFGVSARTKNKKIDAAASSSAKGKNSNKIKKDNKKGNGKNNKKGAGADKKTRKRALSADDVRMKKGKGARGNFFVDKNGKIRPLNTYGTIGGGGLLTLAAGFGLGKIGTVSKGDYNTLLGEKNAAESNFNELQKKYEVIKKTLTEEGLQKIFNDASDGKKKLIESVKKAWALETNEVTKDNAKKGKKFASGRIPQNIKLAFPGYFDEEALKMNNSDFELYLLCRVVSDTLGKGKDKLANYKFGSICKISGGEDKLISFSVSPEDYKFRWKIEGDYNKVDNGIASGGTSGMSLGWSVDFDAFSRTFDSARDTILGGALVCKPEWSKGILADNKYGVISADDCNEMQKFLGESKKATKGYKDFVEWLNKNEGNQGDLQLKGLKNKYSMKTLKQAFSLMCILTNLRMFMSFVSAGASEGKYYDDYSRSGIATALLSVAATEMDDATPKGALAGPTGWAAKKYIKSVAKGCKGKLPDYGIGQLLDSVD